MAANIKINQTDIPALATAAEEFDRRQGETGVVLPHGVTVRLGTAADPELRSLVARHRPEWLSAADDAGTDTATRAVPNAAMRDAHLLVGTPDALFVVGRGPIGVIMGVHRLVDALLDGADPHSLVEWYEPRFNIRTVGHDELYLEPKDGYSRQEHVRWAVQHGFNSVDIQWWMLEPDHVEEKKELNELMERFDLDGLIQGKLLQIFGNLPEEAIGHARQNSGEEITTLCVRSDDGRRRVSEWVQRALREIPRISIMTWYFFDVSFICQDNCPRCGDTPILDRIVEFAQMVDRAVLEVNPDVTTVIRTWHLMPDERRRLAQILPEELGAEAKLSTAGDEAYLPLPHYDPVYNPTEQALYRKAGKRGIVEIPIGDCESVDSLTGVPVPQLTLRRFDDIESWGAPGIRNWWASSYWVYNPNYEVAGRAFFRPTPEPTSLIERVAIRDFGSELAPAVVLFWERWEQLVTSWPFRSWMQRMEIFTDRAYGSLVRPALRPIRPEPFDRMLAHDRLLRPSSREFRRLVPRELESRGNFKEHPLDWVTPVLLAEYERIINAFDDPARTISDLVARASALPDRVRRRLESQKRSFEYFVSLFHSQYAFFRALWIVAQKRSVADRQEMCRWDRELELIAQAELTNSTRMRSLLESDENSNMAQFGPWEGNVSRATKPLLPEQLELVDRKIEETQEWLDAYTPHRDSGVPYAPYVSVDARFYRWGEQKLYEERLVEQSRVLPWYGLEEARWIFPRARQLFEG